MHPLLVLLLSRHASLSQQTAKTYAWNQAQLPKGRAEGNNECDELSTLSLRISRPFKRQRKGRERELEAPRNKWKVISMNNAGRPARSSLSLRLRPAATTNGNCRISARYPKSKRICRGERHGRNSTSKSVCTVQQLCSLRCRIKMAILALSQKGDISEMFLG